MIALLESEVVALRACLEVAHPSEGDELSHDLWAKADKALRMIEGATDVERIVRAATDDTSPKFLVQVDLFNIPASRDFGMSAEGIKGSMHSMVSAAVLNEAKIAHQRKFSRALDKEDALGMLRAIRNSVQVTRVR